METEKDFKTNLRLTYDRQAARRDAGTTQEWKLVERAAFLSLLQKEKHRTLLEIGSGPGKDAAFFQAAGIKTTCIDLSPEMVRLCREKGLDASVMDMTAMTFPPESFDAVYAMNSLLHLTKQELPVVLKRIDGILKRQGLFFLCLWGGVDFEGIRPDDPNEPKRFFSFFEDAHLERVISSVFGIMSFKKLEVGEGPAKLHSQCLVLKKEDRP